MAVVAEFEVDDSCEPPDLELVISDNAVGNGECIIEGKMVEHVLSRVVKKKGVVLVLFQHDGDDVETF
jgi:hypothetical protein